MACIIKNYFDNLTPALQPHSRIKTLKPGKDFSFKKDAITLQFTGNRIDIETGAMGSGTSVNLQVDNQPLKKEAGCFYYTRPALKPDGFFLTHIGVLLAMDLSEKVVEEEWSLTINSVDSVSQHIGFTVKGSITGEDGSGNSGALFTSNSGRISIKPEYWFKRNSKDDFGQFHWLQPGDVLKWKIESMCPDSVLLSAQKTQTLFQGIGNTKHQLKISGKGTKSIKKIIVYAPSLKE